MAAQYQWHSIQAKLSAADGHLDEAESFAREYIQGEAFVTLAFELQAAGKGETVGALGEAISLFEQKGNIVSAERARATLGSLGVAPGATADGEVGVAV